MTTKSIIKSIADVILKNVNRMFTIISVVDMYQLVWDLNLKKKRKHKLLQHNCV